MPTPDQIREHYDSLALIYRAFWGDHIHHGLFTDGEPPETAQVKLIEHCVELAGVWQGADVLDVGSGHGGSSVYLASVYGCRVQGLTLSEKQARLSSQNARIAAVCDRTKFLVEDAESWHFPPMAFDLVWTMESSEHFADKSRYFQNVATTLKSGGKLLLSAWTGSMQSTQVRDVARAFLCPELWSAQQYARAIESAGLRVIRTDDLSAGVARTWEICSERVTKVKTIVPLLPRTARAFVEGIETILQAYRSGALTYSVILALK
ncbi:MAG TPA: class I SAM-dependent methyltransferase [Terriglobales bacterium]|nr:class I SAM-dependent methyltransferase [Terriglobales bacterium]